MKQKLGLILVFSIIFLISCNRSNTNYSDELSEAGPSPTPVQQTEAPTPPPLRGGAHDDIPDLSGAKIIMPDIVKGKWKEVVFMLEDKISHEITEHTVSIGDEWLVPNSDLKIKTVTFLPDLIIQGTVFTSVSNELKNPAVHVIITEKGKELFKGWFFSLFPTMHSFQHSQYSITLKDVIPS